MPLYRWRVLPRQKIGDDAGRTRRLRQPQMPVAESIDHPCRMPRLPDGRQAVRQRRAKAHPLLSALGFQTRQEGFRLGQKRVGTGEIGRKLQPAQFHRTTDADAGGKTGNDEAVAAEGDLRAQIESA